jgi:tRNA U34 5-methylaminomethyl-2-thiouridine-forming methyltransferase MnmC
MPDQSFNDESKLIVTGDGSHTVYSSRFDQHYHNPKGAVAESRYVFFEQTGLPDDLNKHDQITILEIGFGTGLSLLLLMDYYLNRNGTAKIDYYSVEGFPLSSEMAENFNYEQHLNHPELSPVLPSIFDNLSRGMNHFALSKNISLHLFNGMFEDFKPDEEDAKVNYIFHDAFSPDVNPELWTGKVFKKIKNFSTDDAILSTYSASSKAQGALAWAGWKVTKARGALGKREMILAALDPDRLEMDNLNRINEKRYARRYEEGDFE